MIKVYALIPKRLDISDEEFHSHWLDPHGLLALRITTLLGYVQSHGIGASPDVTGIPASVYLGIAQVWFESLDVALGMGNDPNYTEGAGADEPNFVDMAQLAFMFCDEQVVLAGPELAKDTPEVKAMLLLRRAAGTSPEGFRVALGEHGALVGHTTPGLQRYVQCVTLPEMYGEAEPAYDAICELSFPDLAALERAWADQRVAEQLNALGAVADLAASASFLAEEKRFIWPVAAPH